MEQEWNRITRFDCPPEECINKELLSKYTNKIPASKHWEIPWGHVRHLHMIGRDAASRTGVPSGTYMTHCCRWILVVGAHAVQISDLLRLCGPELVTLTIQHTDLLQLDLQDLKGLKTLTLCKNHHVCSVLGLGQLRRLERLTLRNTKLVKLALPKALGKLVSLDLLSSGSLHSLTGLDHLKELESLNLRSTAVDRINLSTALPKLLYLDATHTRLPEADFLAQIPNVRTLNLGFTKIHEIPQLSHCTALEELDLSFTPIRSLEGVAFPDTLTLLDLQGCKISRIPDAVQQLPKLRRLDLTDLKLEALPDWLPKLGLPMGRKFSSDISLADTTVDSVDMSIFDRPQEMILAWFNKQMLSPETPVGTSAADDGTPLNELKIVFLGDGGAGKSRTIARLMKDGENTEHFPDISTPGIAIRDRSYTIGGRTIQVHFWDFGGQDIFHSMHQMFLTERTLYVVMLNVRNSTQRKQGRYWLNNIKSFTKNAPVLIVLNHMDTNRGASIDMEALKEICPELPEAITMSALTDDAQSMRDNLIATLMQQIRAFPSLEASFLPAWIRLKDRLRSMPGYRISGNDFIRYCRECGVEDSEKIRKGLLDWFSDLGVSFCYGGNARLEDYVILKPEWITNAIYTILFNIDPQEKNGIILHDTIYKLLRSESKEIRRTLPGVVYEPHEADYVMEVLRKYRLSYRMDDHREFIPMLCQEQELPVAAEYRNDPDTLAFRLEYNYLPKNILHWLMVDLHRDLDTGQVWRSGALFRQGSTGLSAVVTIKKKNLRIYVRSTNPTVYRPDIYLHTFRSALADIHKSMNLAEPTAFIVYKQDGLSEEYAWDHLLGSLNAGLSTIYSSKLGKPLHILDIFSQSDRDVENKNRELLKDVQDICLQIQSSNFLWDLSEDGRNTYLRNSLTNMQYIVRDQTFMGVGATGKRPGELDLLICNEHQNPWMICEALNVTGSSDSQIKNWNNHLDKLLINYNPLGLQDLILICYVKADPDQFHKLWDFYREHIYQYSPEGVYLLPDTYQETELPAAQYHCLRIARCTYNLGGMPSTVHHYFLRLGK